MVTDPNKVALRGVWTPWSTVWCLPCDLRLGRTEFRTIPPDPEALIAADHEDAEHATIGSCDECGRACWLRSDVGTLQALLRAVNALRTDADTFTASLWQMGGMTCSLGFTFGGGEADPRQILVGAEDRFYVATYTTDEHHEREEPAIEDHPIDVVLVAARLVEIARSL